MWEGEEQERCAYGRAGGFEALVIGNRFDRQGSECTSRGRDDAQNGEVKLRVLHPGRLAVDAGHDLEVVALKGAIGLRLAQDQLAEVALGAFQLVLGRHEVERRVGRRASVQRARAAQGRVMELESRCIGLVGIVGVCARGGEQEGKQGSEHGIQRRWSQAMKEPSSATRMWSKSLRSSVQGPMPAAGGVGTVPCLARLVCRSVAGSSESRIQSEE